MLCLFKTTIFYRNLDFEQTIGKLNGGPGNLKMQKVRSYVMETKAIECRGAGDFDIHKKMYIQETKPINCRGIGDLAIQAKVSYILEAKIRKCRDHGDFDIQKKRSYILETKPIKCRDPGKVGFERRTDDRKKIAKKYFGQIRRH